MKFLTLLYSDETKQLAHDSPEMAAQMEGFNRFYSEVNEAGAFKAGDPVQGSATASTVRVRDGASSSSPGPFAPGPHQLVGFYVLDCADQAEAERYAAKIPTAAQGAVEVRPIMTF